MKFSYSLLKKYFDNLEPAEEVVESLLMYSFEAELQNENVIDIDIPSNRYSDSVSHVGIGKEISAVLNKEMRDYPKLVGSFETSFENNCPVKVDIQEDELVSRYIVGCFEGVEIEESSKEIKEVLGECGIQPVNNVVDVMNYVMLEVGQPLHAFDLDKIEGEEIIIRRAKKDESIKTIDGEVYNLSSSDIVIADKKGPLAIAGIKGGARAEVNEETERIVVESANFDRVSIYRTSRNLGLVTDASKRFSHDIHLELALAGFDRVRDFLEGDFSFDYLGGHDSNPQEFSKKLLSFDIDSFNSFMGTSISRERAINYLERLGFEEKDKKIEVPILRKDIEKEEDLAEEVIRMMGFEEVGSKPPKVSLSKTTTDEIFLFGDEIRDLLSRFGYNEVYTHSFIGQAGSGKVKLSNPISSDRTHLRDSLLPLLLEKIEDNFRFFEKVRLFEVGKVFEKKDKKIEEWNSLGVAIGTKREEGFFELKGIVAQLLERLGLIDFSLPPSESFEGLEVKSDDQKVGKVVRWNEEIALAELNLEKLMTLVDEEISFEPLPKYPASSRDLSIVLPSEVRIGEVIQSIEVSPVENIENVDLIDEYFEDNMQSITLRIVFRSSEKTLSSEEIDEKMKKVKSILEEEYGVDIR
ncbi:MAG: phenylalanine--tRNA ligase subunit beta [Candidatus Magasanikbacteria bacterium]